MEIVKTKVCLQYRKNTAPYFKEEYMPFVAIDRNSGGYPYEEYIENAHDFKTEEKAKEYDIRDEFDIRIITVRYNFS